ncbi:MAG: HAD family hydrolase [Candidatus Rokuibacteriota bacterium]
MKVEAITVDLWGTLFFDGPSSDNRYKKRRMADVHTLLTAAGLSSSASSLDRAYEESGAYLARIWSTHRDVPAVDHVRAILAAVDPGLPRRVPPALLTALVDAYARPILLLPPAVDDGALAALETLKGAGYKLALVSNIMRTPGTTLRQLLGRFRLLGYFDQTTFSDEVGVRKPAPEIFALTLRALGAAAASAVHVGDDPVLDVQGAHAAGMRVIQVTSSPRRSSSRPDLAISRLADLPAAVEQLEA